MGRVLHESTSSQAAFVSELSGKERTYSLRTLIGKKRKRGSIWEWMPISEIVADQATDATCQSMKSMAVHMEGGGTRHCFETTARTRRKTGD